MSWQEWDGEGGPDGHLVYYKPKARRGEPRELADALRYDGITYSLYEAFRLVDGATYVTSFYGYPEEGREPVACNEGGLTETGDQVPNPIACVFAVLRE